MCIRDRLGMECNPTIVDTVALARVLLPQLNRFKLDTVAKALNISLDPVSYTHLDVYKRQHLMW